MIRSIMATRTTVAGNVSRQLSAHSGVVVTPRLGTRKIIVLDDYLPIGDALFQEVMPKLEKGGLTVDVFSFEELAAASDRPEELDYGVVSAAFARARCALSPAQYDAFVFEHAQCMLDTRQNPHYMAESREPLSRLWEEVRTQAGAGKKFIFGSLFHPLTSFFSECEYLPGSGIFISDSPIIELGEMNGQA